MLTSHADPQVGILRDLCLTKARQHRADSSHTAKIHYRTWLARPADHPGLHGPQVCPSTLELIHYLFSSGNAPDPFLWQKEQEALKPLCHVPAEQVDTPLNKYKEGACH